MRRLYAIPTGALRSLDEWRTALTDCAALGFQAVLLLASSKNIFAQGRTDPASITQVIELASDYNLNVVVDAPIDKIPIDAPEAARLGLGGLRPRLRDPRVAPGDKFLVQAPLERSLEREAWINALKARLSKLRIAGASGFSFRPSRATPPDVISILSAGNGVQEGPNGRPEYWTWISDSDALDKVKGADVRGGFLPTSSLIDLADSTAFNQAIATVGDVILYPSLASSRQASQSEDALALERRLVRELWLCATLGAGMMIPMGFEYGVSDAVAHAGLGRSWRELSNETAIDISREIIAATDYASHRDSDDCCGPLEVISLESPEVWGAVQHVERSQGVRLVLANRSVEKPTAGPAAVISSEIGEYLPLKDMRRSEPSVTPEGEIAFRAGEVRIFEGRRSAPIKAVLDGASGSIAHLADRPRLVIEKITPSVESGRYAVKRVVGDVVRVEADVYGEGHDPIVASLLWRAIDEPFWRETEMRSLGNDRWVADFPLERVGRYFYTIEAWRDEYAIYRSELIKKRAAGLPLLLELQEGRALLENIAKRAADGKAGAVEEIVKALDAADEPARLLTLLAPETAAAFRNADPRDHKVRLDPGVLIESERKTAAFAAWYELFPRSQSGDPARHGTFEDVIKRLPAVRDMGFDVIYFPPIHPIGQTNRKGPNNSLNARPGDPGSPYAIGSSVGGHEAIHPALGDIGDFQRLFNEAEKLGLEIALDFAVQASPDHPWLKEHPGWFVWRPDGTIKYAENPPKKYEDIVNVDFYSDGAKPSLWLALRDTVRLWIDRGVRLFRVDNPHTKPFPFWEWLIDDIRRDHPDVVFLAEAFTRPKVMYYLAKIGFSQSYTYFTWRNTKSEITSYVEELTTEAQKEFFRPHFFVNTPDINPDFLQNAPRSAYLIRAALAATLSGLWGLYNGFELCEGRPDAQRKEYADSEKYQIRAWDWNRPGNIVSEITALNRIRRDNPALHSHLGVTFHNAWNDQIVYFRKTTKTRANVILVAVSLDPYAVQEADIEAPLWTFGLSDEGSLQVEDLMRGAKFVWKGKRQHVRLDPGELPFSIWRLSQGLDF
jgi:starch synthase (maltosyl-transferring)